MFREEAKQKFLIQSKYDEAKKSMLDAIKND